MKYSFRQWILHFQIFQCQCQCQSKIFSVARIAELSRSPRRRSRVRELYCEKDWRKRNVFRRWRKTCRDGDDWMSDVNEFSNEFFFSTVMWIKYRLPLFVIKLRHRVHKIRSTYPRGSLPKQAQEEIERVPANRTQVYLAYGRQNRSK